MILFPIQFSYAGVSYKATVHKITGNPVQFLVSEYEPLNKSFLEPYVFVWNEKDNELNFSINPDILTLGGEIAAAIFKGCSENYIAYDK